MKDMELVALDASIVVKRFVDEEGSEIALKFRNITSRVG